MFTSEEIEKQIERYPLRFLSIRDPRVEWDMKLPMFLDTFNIIIRAENRIPSQDQFVKKYFSDNEPALIDLTESMKMGLEARLRRTYPSFVRDIHFAALLREHGLDVSQDRDTDVFGGVDYVIKFEGHAFYIHCYVKTRRGRFGRRIKNRRHDFRGVHLDVEMDLGAESAKSVGDFYLYSDEHVNRLKKLLENESKKAV